MAGGKRSTSERKRINVPAYFRIGPTVIRDVVVAAGAEQVGAGGMHNALAVSWRRADVLRKAVLLRPVVMMKAVVAAGTSDDNNDARCNPKWKLGHALSRLLAPWPGGDDGGRGRRNSPRRW